MRYVKELTGADREGATAPALRVKHANVMERQRHHSTFLSHLSSRVLIVVCLPVIAGCAEDEQQEPGTVVVAPDSDDFDIAYKISDAEAEALAATTADLDSGADVNAPITKRALRTRLHRAAARGHVRVAQLLIRRGADVGATDKKGRTPLDMAVAKGNTNVARLLRRNGATPTKPSYEIDEEEAEVLAEVKAYLAQGGDIDLPVHTGTSGQTRLHRAAISGHIWVAEFLIANGAELDSREELGVTPLLAAAAGLHWDMVRFLLSKGAEPNVSPYSRLARGVTPIRSAVMDGQEVIVELLLTSGADLHELDSWGGTLLHAAAGAGQLDMIEFLIRKGLDINAKQKGNGATLLHLAASNGHVATVDSLLAMGLDVNVRAKNGETSLHYAAANGHNEVIETLIEKGADVNVRSENGLTPLHNAIEYDKAQTVAVLRGHGAKE